MHAHPQDCHPSGELSIDANAGAGFCSAPIHVYMSAGADEVGVSSQESAEDGQRRREHLSSALHALQTILEAQPRLSAIMASVAALAPICNCIEPICR